MNKELSCAERKEILNKIENKIKEVESDIERIRRTNSFLQGLFIFLVITLPLVVITTIIMSLILK